MALVDIISQYPNVEEASVLAIKCGCFSEFFDGLSVEQRKELSKWLK